jgi:hypothetical protein
VKNEGYVALPDPAAEKHGQIRVVDGSGEDYVYPKNFFVPISLPQSLRKAMSIAA